MIFSDLSVSFSHEGVVGEIGSRGVPGITGGAVSFVLYCSSLASQKVVKTVD